MAPDPRDNLTSRVHAELRAGLLHGRLRPGQRLKIRELASAMGVSETPVREAVMQLVREGGLELRPASAIRVVRLSLSDYLELRRIRLLLEGLAAEEAARRATPPAVAALAQDHAALEAAEASGEWQAAIEANFRFHHGLWRLAGMPNLLGILEGIWLRNGPLLNLLYPDAKPSYLGRHRHLDILDGLRARDAEHTRAAMHADLVEGGRGLLWRLEELEATESRCA
ncbi:GntR family transcriptional regulator [Roseococcus thiosulfatophilus]|uniref:GntR family transcriptional regulator n=1 Tax=Roseococcus thiosulfatophilus TaxID=35813 RepID=UPI001A8C6130|nr:GntR family transcriptional regulator [Roseococcus thiosulfatophilus]